MMSQSVQAWVGGAQISVSPNLKVKEGFLEEETSDLSLQIGIRVGQEESARWREMLHMEMWEIMAHLGMVTGFRHEEEDWDEVGGEQGPDP